MTQRPKTRPSPERLEQARRLLEDGASKMEVTRTTGLANETINRHFPGTGWTHQEAGAHGMVLRRASPVQQL